MYNYVEHKQENVIVPQKSYKVNNLIEMPSGIYQVREQRSLFSSQIIFHKNKVKEDLVKFSTGIVKEIVDKIDKFFTSDVIGRYSDINVPHKMGMIMYGPPGTGKTSSAFLIMSTIATKYSGICLDCSYQDFSAIRESVRLVRESNPNSPIIIFCDEFENSIRRDEESYLSFLDGSHSESGIVFIGCTNYLNRIPDRIKNRKSRIKYVFKIKSLPLEVYEEYLKTKAPVLPTNTVKEIAFKSEDKGLTIDQLKHVLIDYHVENVSIDEAIENVSVVFKDNPENEDEDED
jgi:SpoVK/Ycf46/Vps4 family AAA+-type ATPase